MTSLWEVFGVLLAGVSVILILVGLVLTWDTYWQQRFDIDMGQIRATHAMLLGARRGMEKWGTPHFGEEAYDDETAKVPACRSYEGIKKNEGYFRTSRFRLNR